MVIYPDPAQNYYLAPLYVNLKQVFEANCGSTRLCLRNASGISGILSQWLYIAHGVDGSVKDRLYDQLSFEHVLIKVG